MAVVTIDTLAKEVATNFELKKSEGSRLVNFVLEAIADHLKETDEIKLNKFGILRVIPVGPRTVRNLHTKEEVNMPATTRVQFVASKALKSIVGEAVDAQALLEAVTAEKAARSEKMRAIREQKAATTEG